MLTEANTVLRVSCRADEVLVCSELVIAPTPWQSTERTFLRSVSRLPIGRIAPGQFSSPFVVLQSPPGESPSLAKDDIARLFDLVRRLRKQGHAIIYISHFLEEVKQISDRFVVLRDGASLERGDVQEWAGRSLASFKVPAYVEFCDSLPYTQTGKVMKHQLEA